MLFCISVFEITPWFSQKGFFYYCLHSIVVSFYEIYSLYRTVLEAVVLCIFRDITIQQLVSFGKLSEVDIKDLRQINVAKKKNLSRTGLCIDCMCTFYTFQ